MGTMIPDKSEIDQTASAANAKVAQNPKFLEIIAELDLNRDQHSKRVALLKEIESLLDDRYKAKNRVVSYILRFGHARTSMLSMDIPSFETTIASVTGAEQLNVILHSPGGDGTIVEKMVDMCRAHISGGSQHLRVIVPNIAKSAATMLALGADTIVMGYCSELGPIDPQVQIAVSGVVQWVSALAFVETRDQLMTEIANAVAAGRPTIGQLQQLAGLNIPFTHEMENAINFAKNTGATLLNKYMLRLRQDNAKKREEQANEIAEKLLSKQLFPVHGQFIDGATASKLGLNVEVLDKDDELWQKIWQYYVRCEVQMNIPLQNNFIKTKLFESSAGVSLVAQDTPQ